jgi:response regulator RpfG family c-di-GMP phosphodiesterase
MLRDLGYIVLEAEDGPHALEVAQRSESTIDLLLTDVVMPGMSGRALSDKLSSIRPNTRVLFMSGYTDGAIAAHGVLESGISILRKPFTRDELVGRVQEVLSEMQNHISR